MSTKTPARLRITMRVVSAHCFARGAQSKEARKRSCWPPGHRISALVVIAVDLLKEDLGVECVGLAGNAGDDRKRNQRDNVFPWFGRAAVNSHYLPRTTNQRPCSYRELTRNSPSLLQ